MTKTNSLTSHHAESSAHRADKMSGMTSGELEYWTGKSKKDIKKFTNKKRRQLLKNTDKI